MGQLVICKACGFIMLEEKLGDVCPACGVLKKMFEPHNDRVSEKRRKVLEMHIHPIMVHFSQAFAFSVFLLAIGMLIFSGRLGSLVLSSLEFISYCLPIVAIATFLTGVLDGRTRFKKVKSPILRKKIAYGTGFLIFTLALGICTLVLGYSGSALRLIIIALALGSFGSSFVLGLLGTSLINSALPGK